MRCPKCQAEIAVDVKTCPACGQAVARGPRRKAKQVLADPTQIKDEELGNPPARVAYRCALYGLIPVLGLVLGPLAVGFGCVALRCELRKVGGRVWIPVALMFVGLLIVLGNWGGVAMMVYGLFFAPE
jgi:hypothetical protein